MKRGLLNCGRRSRIYDFGGGEVVKLYDKNFSALKIEAEFEKTKLIFQIGKVDVPRPIKTTVIDDCRGIVFEKIDGVSFLDLFQKRPWRYFFWLPRVTKIHRKIGKIVVPGLPSQEEEFGSLIANSKKLGEKEKETVSALLRKNNSQKLCHGDFQPGNLLLAGKKVYVLDWMDAFLGNPVLDLALTAVNTIVSSIPKYMSSFNVGFYELLKKVAKLDRIYINAYGKRKGKKLGEMLLLASAIHLSKEREYDHGEHRKYFDQAWNNCQRR